MANKYYRENLKSGTNPFKRKSNIAKITETFGPKKKVKKNKKPIKRMFANKGGGADSGKPISKSKNPGLLAMSKTEKGKEAIKKMKFNPNRIVAKKGGKA